MVRSRGSRGKEGAKGRLATISAWSEQPEDDIGYLLNLFGLKQKITDEDGKYRLSGLAPGRYDVVIQAQLDRMARSSVIVAHYSDIDTGADEAVLEILEDDLPTSRLGGRVLDATGRPLGNARVIAVRVSNIAACSAEALSGADGRFSIGPLTRGEYSLRVEIEGGALPTFAGQHTMLARRDEDVGDVRVR